MLKKITIFLLTLFIIINAEEPRSFLIFGGKTGWMGQKVVKIIQDLGHVAICAESRLENSSAMEAEIQSIMPDFIINAAGITGRPNIDWCEQHKQETFEVNVVGTLNLVQLATKYNIHLTNLTTGCLYTYDEKHPMGSGVGFTEEEKPNLFNSIYAKTKIILEDLLTEYPEVLNLRIKMPISTEFDKGFVGKIINFKKVVNFPNSLAVLDELLPIAVDMTLKKVTGCFNFVNPGSLSHHEVLELYKEYVDPSHRYGCFTQDELSKIPVRSNAVLSTSKLLKLYPNILPIRESLIQLFKKIKMGLNPL